jgi:hypothetical protein
VRTKHDILDSLSPDYVIVDHEDGSATVTLDLSPETYHKIFEYGFLKLITKGMDIDVPAKTP